MLLLSKEGTIESRIQKLKPLNKKESQITIIELLQSSKPLNPIPINKKSNE
jgi:hypothetical protein